MKTTLRIVLVSILLNMNIFTPCSSVSIVNFEHVIADWEAVKHGNNGMPYLKYFSVKM